MECLGQNTLQIWYNSLSLKAVIQGLGPWTFGKITVNHIIVISIEYYQGFNIEDSKMRHISSQSATGYSMFHLKLLAQELSVIKVTRKIVPRNPDVCSLPTKLFYTCVKNQRPKQMETRAAIKCEAFTGHGQQSCHPEELWMCGEKNLLLYHRTNEKKIITATHVSEQEDRL